VKIAIDSNVISALWSAEPAASIASSHLHKARNGNRFVICAPVYAELMGHPNVSESALENFLAEAGVAADFDLTAEVWQEAGRRFSRYATRRRRSGGGHPRRLLVDFLVGTHALLKADRLLTFDRDRYRRDFPDLDLL